MKFKLSKQLAAGFVGIGLSIGNSYADDVLNSVVVSGARIEQSIADVLPSVTVITRQEIEQSQANTIADLLQGEPGFEFGRNGGVGTATSFFLRGENSISMAIYIDGVKAPTDAYGDVQGLEMPMGMIDRIEILRGNAGAMYGEAAIGGVINIYTRQGGNDVPKAYGTMSYGSWNTLDTTLGYGGLVNGSRFNITANDTSSNGIAPLNNAQNPYANPNAGAFERQSLNGTLSRKYTDDLEAGVNAKFLTSNISYADEYSGPSALYDDGTGPSTTLNMKTISSDVTVFAKYALNSNWISRLDLTQSDLTYEFYSNLANDFGSGNVVNPSTIGTNYTTFANQTAAKWFNTYKFDGEQTVNFGADYAQANYNDGNGNLSQRDAMGYFAGYNQRFERLDVQVNSRHDGLRVAELYTGQTNQNFQVNSGLFGLGFFITDNFKLTGTMSTGFRAPAAGELFGYGGNPNLQPETHHGNEFGFVYTQSDTMGRLVYFDTKTNNAIDYVGSSYVNIPTVTNHGLELTAKSRIAGFNVSGAFTAQNPMDVSTGEQMARRAKDFGSLDIDKPVGRYDFGTKLVFSGTRPDLNYTATAGPQYAQYVTLSSYQIWNFFASMKIDEEWTARVKLENAFNESYQLVYGYNTPGRGLFFTLDYRQK